MMKIALVSTLMVLAGCQTQPVGEMSYSKQKEWAQGIVQRCHDQGITKDPELKLCIRAEAKRDIAMRYKNRVKRKRARSALAKGLKDYGDQMQANARNQQLVNAINRPVTCSSVPSPAGMTKVRCH